MEKKLPTEFKARWLTALRSGKYQQDTRCLRTNRGFCCLGVACDLANPATWLHPTEYNDLTDQEYLLQDEWITANNSHEMPVTGDLPDAVLRALRQPSGEMDGAEPINVMRNIALRNDNGETFEQIAAWIEENL